MKAAWVLGLLLLQTAGGASDDPAWRQKIQRNILVPDGSAGQACAVLDADVYAHAGSSSLNDLRLFAQGRSAEVPFTLTESNTARVESEDATVRNLGTEGGTLVFDLEMPKRPYTEVELTLHAKDFIGVAKVSGRGPDGRPVALGSFAVFDLSGQHLSRSTALQLQESTFPELHVELELHPAPGSAAQHFGSEVVGGAAVPPSRVAQTLYTVVAAADTWSQHGRDSITTMRLPAHVPVERAEIEVDRGYRNNFLREVTITAKPDTREDADSPVSDVETVSGEISQVHMPPEHGASGAALPVDSRKTTIDAVLAADLRSAATVEVKVANGNDAPLPLRMIQLQMRERRICFDAMAGVRWYTLLYGDKELPAPVYDYSRLFVPAVTPVKAMLAVETRNPHFVPREEKRQFTERHPQLLWLALLAALAALGGVALRNMRHQRGVTLE